MKPTTLLAPLVALLLAAAPLGAQERERGDDNIPPGFRPPPGMCRIWLDNVPPGQQPAPTDCSTAVRNRPPNGRVIFGDEPRPNGRPAPKPKKLRGQPVDSQITGHYDRPHGPTRRGEAEARGWPVPSAVDGRAPGASDDLRGD